MPIPLYTYHHIQKKNWRVPWKIPGSYFENQVFLKILAWRIGFVLQMKTKITFEWRMKLLLKGLIRLSLSETIAGNSHAKKMQSLVWYLCFWKYGEMKLLKNHPEILYRSFRYSSLENMIGIVLENRVLWISAMLKIGLWEPNIKNIFPNRE